MQEIWKNIKDYPDYQVSNLGRVKSLERYVNHKIKGFKQLKQCVILKLIIHKTTKTYRYYEVALYKNKKAKTHRVHRLVAQAFIPNPENKPQINHIDSNPLNNNINNLEWVTSKENNIHAWKYGKHIRKVVDDKQIIKEYESGLSFERISMNNNTSPTTVSRVLRENNIKIRTIFINKKIVLNIDKIKLLELLSNGVRNVDIAKIFNCRPNLIADYKRRFIKNGELL